MRPDHQYHSLDDFLASTMSHIDGVLDDGFGFGFPVKGREIDAVVLFADISGFSTRTLDMSPTETLVYVQNFFAWITAEALHGRPGIVDKYIGDEIMVVFSTEFGSADPFADAVQAAAAMIRRDVHSYHPHIGIASGPVIVGYAGTAMHYNVSVFGAPVALAARCAGVPPEVPEGQVISTSIVFPEVDWAGRDLDGILPMRRSLLEDGTEYDEPREFELQAPREVTLKGVGNVSVREIFSTDFWFPGQSAEARARESVAFLHRSGRYWPRWDRDLTADGRTEDSPPSAEGVNPRD